MSKPLTGSKMKTATGWQASLPMRRGATERASHVFRSEEAADRWLAAGRATITAGLSLPVPAGSDAVPSSRAQRATGTAFGPLAKRWADEYYSELHRGQADREQTVRGHIRRITEFMEDRGLVVETMVRDQVKALQASVTRTPVNPPAVTVPDGLALEDLVTMQQA